MEKTGEFLRKLSPFTQRTALVIVKDLRIHAMDDLSGVPTTYKS